VLGLFALLLFALLSIMTLVIDLGLVTLTRVQMQQAADTAAVEGLRGRNPGFDDGFKGDCLRRRSAANLAAWTFDDDFDPTSDALQLGAGPDVALVDGVGDLDAGAAIELSPSRVYSPQLQRNQSGNVAHGDMVSGAFAYTADPRPQEASDYLRADFAPLPPIGPGTNGLAGCPRDDDFTGVPASGATPLRDPAFLVRLRRTPDRDGLDDVPDVSSRGSTLPLLFGRGTTIQPGPDAGFSVRRDGLTVRATAIADQRPALRVGSGVPFLSAVPLVIERAFWETTCWDDNLTPVVVDPGTGVVTGAGVCAGAIVGRFVASAPTTVGQQVQPAPPPPGDVDGFAALMQIVPGATVPRVVGFGWISLQGGTLIKLPGKIAPSNASAHLVAGWPEPMPASERIAVMSANASLAAEGTPVRRLPLLAPVLAR
jgi:hypothetical protein